MHIDYRGEPVLKTLLVPLKATRFTKSVRNIWLHCEMLQFCHDSIALI